MSSEAPLTDLERHLAELAHVQQTDFRAANLFALVAREIPGGSRVLDVGCGAGGLVASLLSKAIDARGIDASDAVIRAARAFFERVGLDPGRVKVEDIAALVERGETYDVVTSMDCIEHVEDDAGMLRAMVRLLRPGGRLVLTVPALMALYGERDVRIGHFRRYEKAALRTLVAAQGLEIQQLRFWNLLGVPPTFISQKVLGRNVDESFRWGRPTLRKRVLRSVLGAWFTQVENRVAPPLGLTLFLVATRPGQPAEDSGGVRPGP